MVQKIPKLILGSVVIGLFVMGCQGNPPKKDEKSPNTSSKEQAQSKDKLTELQELERNPIKWITKLKQENQALKTKLGNLNTLLSDAKKLEVQQNPQVLAVKDRITKLEAQKVSLESKVTTRFDKLNELKRLIAGEM
ncbi:hypothetical protein [Candidatus Parabeggiatoa sp. HSG14]|uniref:hypothetical protein n=1 Tax=Candidatus Parabeggiatoa sp. HSG14 TaxID=3055593 RepID=UPI0025A9057E|nr:hypothetical protein [Thiotrichales bacterium HSG14]